MAELINLFCVECFQVNAWIKSLDGLNVYLTDVCARDQKRVSSSDTFSFLTFVIPVGNVIYVAEWSIIVNITPVQIFTFCCEPFIELFFSHLRTNQSAARQVRDPSTRTNANRKDPSLVSKSHEVELPNWVLQKCRESVLLYVMENCHEKNNFFDILPFFQSGNGSNRLIVIGNVQY